MKQTGWVLPGLAFLGVLAVVVLFFRHRPVSPADWAAWVQAVGSVIAIFSVIWLAHTDERRRHSRELQNAAIAAIAVRMLLTPVQGLLPVICEATSRYATTDAHPNNFALIGKQLGNAVLPTEEQLHRLTEVPSDAASDLAYAVGQIRQAKLFAEIAYQTSPELESNERKHQFVNVATGLRLAKLHMDRALANIDRFVSSKFEISLPK